MIYYFLFTTAFLTGLAGSLHCVGMCGPIALALPIGHYSSVKKKIAIILYHGGRIITYSFLGFWAGIAGNSVRFLGLQQIVITTTGIFLLLSVLPYRYLKSDGITRIVFKIKQVFFSEFNSRKLGHLFKLGLLNGLLPCGTVYLALAAGLLVGNPFISSAYMMFFGLGTLPMLLSISFTYQLLPLKIKHRLSKLSTIFIVLFGLFFIAKGVNLPIPYLGTHLANDRSKPPTLLCR